MINYSVSLCDFLLVVQNPYHIFFRSQRNRKLKHALGKVGPDPFHTLSISSSENLEISKTKRQICRSVKKIFLFFYFLNDFDILIIADDISVLIETNWATASQVIFERR